MTEAIKVEGLAAFNRSLKQLDAALPKALRLALNEAADLVVTGARTKVPRRTGRAASSIKAKSTRTKVRVSEGGRRAVYMPWLDYGGEGRRRGRPPKRPFIREGRYVYKAYFGARDSGEFERVLTKALLGVAASAGVEVD